MAGDPEKNWGLVALMALLIIAVFAMTFFSFRWARPGDRYNGTGTTTENGTGGGGDVTIVPPPVNPAPTPVN